MNRVYGRSPMPQPTGPFSDAEALQMLAAYRKDPSDVPCPKCGPDTIEVLAFIVPDIDPYGFAALTAPVGNYAAAVYCHTCHRAIGILPDAITKEAVYCHTCHRAIGILPDAITKEGGS